MFDPASCALASILCVGAGMEFDTNQGNTEDAFQAAADVVNPGDTIVIRAGTYKHNLNAYTHRTFLRIDRSGTAANPIKIVGAEEDTNGDGGIDGNDLKPHIIGFDFTDGATSRLDNETLLEINGDHIHVTHLEFSDSTQLGVIVNGNFNIVEELDVHDCFQSGISAGRNNTLTEGNIFRYNHIYRIRHGNGITLARRSTHSTLLRNNTVEYNIAHDNGYMPNGGKVPAITGDPAGGGNSDGIGATKDCHDRTIHAGGTVDALNLCPDNTVHHNIVWHNADDGYDFSFGDGSRVFGNIGWENGPEGNKGIKLLRNVLGGLQIYDNVLFSQGRGLEPRFHDNGQVINNTVFGNNAQGIIASADIGSSAISVVNNLSFHNGSSDIAVGDSFTNENNWTEDDDGIPSVVNPDFSSSDIITDCRARPTAITNNHQCYNYIFNQVKTALSPQAGSGLIDAGALVSGLHCTRADDDNDDPMRLEADCRHWRGGAPDIGAYEYGETHLNPPMPPVLLDVK